MMSLAATYSVNKVTVRRAMAQLYAAGLIYSVPSQGTYVAENRPLTTFSLQRRPLTVGLLSLDNAVDRSEPYFMEIIQGMRDELGRYQGSLTMLPVRKNEPEIRIISRLVRAQLDAIVYLGMPNSPILQKLIREGPPGVLVDCRCGTAWPPTAPIATARRSRPVSPRLGPSPKTSAVDRRCGCSASRSCR